MLSSAYKYEINVPGFKSATVPYYKPGIALAHAVENVWRPNISFYFLKNHGVLIVGNTMEEIVQKMKVKNSSTI